MRIIHHKALKMNTFNFRYKEFLYQVRRTSAELARDFGYSSATKLNRLEPQHGENNPSIEIVADIIRAYPDLNERWLLLGEEPMWKSKKQAQNFAPQGNKTIKAGGNVLNDSENSYIGAAEHYYHGFNDQKFKDEKTPPANE